MIFGYFWFIVVYFITSSNAATIKATPAKCGSNSPHYALSAGEVKMFQSPDYPKSLSSGTTNNSIQCSASFTRNDNNGTLLIYLFNGNMGQFVLQNTVEIDTFYNFGSNGYTTYNSNTMRNRVFYGENNPNVTFSFGPSSDFVDWTAFQGLVYAPTNSGFNSNCLMVGESFNLTAKTQIIPLFAYGNRSTQQEGSCMWTFNIPSGFQLKVVVMSIYLHESETLNVVGRTRANIEDVGSYVIEGQNIQIIYTKNHLPSFFYPNSYGFDGYVTLAKSKNSKSKSCRSDQSNNGVIYSNFHKNNGYDNDMTCAQQMIGNFSEIYYLRFTKNYYERYSDIIQVKDSKNETYSLDFETIYYYEPSSNEESDYLEFTSDGNVVQGGFEILQSLKNCTCHNQQVVAPCYNTTVIGFTGDGSDFGYCSNLNCNISIATSPDCPDKFILLKISMLFRKNNNDSVVLLSNTIPNTFEGDGSAEFASFHNFFPYSPTTIKLRSGPSPSTIYESPMVYVTLSTFTPPKLTKIILTEENPVFGLDLSKDIIGYYNVSVPKGYTLDVSMAFNENTGDQYNYFNLYDGVTYEATLSILHYPDSSTKHIPRRYKSHSGCIIVHSAYNKTANITLFFRNIDVHSRNCSDENNIFQLNGGYPTVETNFTVDGGDDGSCMYTILNYPSQELHIAQLEVDMDSEILFVAGVDGNYPLFSFDKDSASKWNAVNLKGLFNSFIIPENHRVTVGIIDSIHDNSSFDPNIASFRGIIYPENYFDPNTTAYPDGIMLSEVTFAEMSTIQITCKFLDLGEGDEVTVSGYNVTSVEQVILIDNNTAEINYISNTVGNRGFLLEFASVTEFSESSNRIGLLLAIPFLLPLLPK